VVRPAADMSDAVVLEPLAKLARHVGWTVIAQQPWSIYAPFGLGESGRNPKVWQSGETWFHQARGDVGEKMRCNRCKRCKGSNSDPPIPHLHIPSVGSDVIPVTPVTTVIREKKIDGSLKL